MWKCEIKASAFIYAISDAIFDNDINYSFCYKSQQRRTIRNVSAIHVVCQKVDQKKNKKTPVFEIDFVLCCYLYVPFFSFFDSFFFSNLVLCLLNLL